jgi:hypothetical protein
MATCQKCKSKHAVRYTITRIDGTVVCGRYCILCAQKIMNGGDEHDLRSGERI